MFIATILAIVAAAKRLVAIPRQAVIASAYGIGTIAAFWSVERLDAMLRPVDELLQEENIDAQQTSKRPTALLRNSALASVMFAACCQRPRRKPCIRTLATSTQRRRRSCFRSSGPIRLMPDEIFRPDRCSATRTCTPLSRWTPARSAPGSAQDAYRFAKGEEVTSSSGQPAKLSRPLDFLVVADHSDNMGFFPDLFAGNPELLADPPGRKWYDMIQSGKGRRRRSISSSRSRTAPSKGPISISPAPTPTVGVAGDHQGSRRSQRSRPLHRLHRLRMDVQHRRQQSAS